MTAYFRCTNCGEEFEVEYPRLFEESSPENRLPWKCLKCRHRRKAKEPNAISDSERAKRWRQKNPDRVKEYKLRIPLQEWLQQVEAFHRKCYFCGKHLNPESGSRDPDAIVCHRLNPNRKKALANSVPACRSCHNTRAGARGAKVRYEGFSTGERDGFPSNQAKTVSPRKHRTSRGAHGRTCPVSSSDSNKYLFRGTVDVKKKIENLQISKSAVAELAGVTPPELSKFIRNERLVSRSKARRIHETVDDVELLLKASDLMQLPKFDFADTVRIRAAIQRLKTALQDYTDQQLDATGMHRLLDSLAAQQAVELKDQVFSDDFISSLSA